MVPGDNKERVCPKCRLSKLVTFFGVHKASGKIRTYCRNCESVTNTAYRKSDPEREKARKAAWYRANVDRAREHQAIYRRENVEKIKSSQYKPDAEKMKTYQAAYRAANAVKLKEYQAAYRKVRKAEKARMQNGHSGKTDHDRQQVAELAAGVSGCQGDAG